MTLGEFIRAAAGLKELKRAGWAEKLSMSDGESVADHSFGAAITAMILSDAMGIDSERAVKMALLHDIAESEIGDITPDSMPHDKKEKLEAEAFLRIASMLPEEMRAEYVSIWDEFCAGETPEARIVAQADKLDMALQAVTYERAGRASRAGASMFVDAASASIKDKTAGALLADITSHRKSGNGADGRENRASTV
ncbi:MAG: HD domain-containing protein [Nitrosopumilaceae archaeon]|nr:HD domain-containing protein [Nitrosopumilaceae archaeon]